MADCDPITGLKLDASSRAGIQTLQKTDGFMKALSMWLAAGTLHTIFTRSNSVQTAWNITQTDWIHFSEAMSRVPDLSRWRIEKEIDEQILYHTMAGHQKQRRFWEQIKAGCQKW